MRGGTGNSFLSDVRGKLMNHLLCLSAVFPDISQW